MTKTPTRIPPMAAALDNFAASLFVAEQLRKSLSLKFGLTNKQIITMTAPRMRLLGKKTE